MNAFSVKVVIIPHVGNVGLLKVNLRECNVDYNRYK